LTTYNHRREIVCAVVPTAGPRSFQRLLSGTVDLAFVDAIKVFIESRPSTSGIANNDLDGCGLVEVERPMIASKDSATQTRSKYENPLGHVLLSKRQTISLQPPKVLVRPRNELIIQCLCPGFALSLSQNQNGRCELGEILQITIRTSVSHPR